MKVNMALLLDDETDVEAVADDNEAQVDEDDEETEDDELDESDKHSKLKTVLLVALMLGGFAVFVFYMIGFVNNMRLENQGSATTNIVYEADDRLDNFMGSGEDGSITVDVDDYEENEVPTDAVRDDPVSEEPDKADTVSYENESEAIAAMRKEVDEANNHAALVEQELKNAEDMLDSSLQREAELQDQIDQLTGNN